MKFFLLIFSFIFLFSNAQDCNLKTSKISEILKVDKNDLICLAKSSDKPFTMFFTFASWCKPCRLHLKDFVTFCKNNNIESYLILLEGEDDKKILKAISYIKENSTGLKLLVLKNEDYGNEIRERNAKFVKEITPKEFELIEDLSKFIFVSKNGEILYVTNYKDYNKDWKDADTMLNRTIYPLIKN